jgi:hypothetical protein
MTRPALFEKAMQRVIPKPATLLDCSDTRCRIVRLFLRSLLFFSQVRFIGIATVKNCGTNKNGEQKNDNVYTCKKENRMQRAYSG